LGRDGAKNCGALVNRVHCHVVGPCVRVTRRSRPVRTYKGTSTKLEYGSTGGAWTFDLCGREGPGVATFVLVNITE